MRSQWLAAAFVLSLILAILQFWAVEEYLFWRYPWFDVPMHLLGGIAIAAFLVPLILERRAGLFAALFALALIGWEVFEYVFGIPRELNYAFDTALDLLMGTIGGIMVYTVARITIWR